jgi:hypothetical protein
MLHRKAEIEKQHFRKEGLRKRIICKALVPGMEEEIHIGLHIQTSFKRAPLESRSLY